MDIILGVLIGITAFTFIYFIWVNWNQINLHIQMLQIKFSWFSYVFFITELIVVSLIYYYVLPHFFKEEDLMVAFLTIYTIVNFAAIFLSWMYFNNTHCYRDEANKLAQKLYFIVGEDIGHLIMLISRIIINYVLADFLISGRVVLEGDFDTGFKTILFFYAFNCAIYTVEMFANISANFYGEVIICKNVHALCKNYGVACDVPAKLRAKLKNATKK